MPIGEENCRHCDKRGNKIISDMHDRGWIVSGRPSWKALYADPLARNDGYATLTTIPSPLIIGT
jgi:hypothetical protein